MNRTRKGEEMLQLEGLCSFVVCVSKLVRTGLASGTVVPSRFRKEDERLKLEEALEVGYFLVFRVFERCLFAKGLASCCRNLLSRTRKGLTSGWRSHTEPHTKRGYEA
jgi:hypothetical protein